MRLNQWAESCDPRQLRLGEHKKQLHAQGRVNAQIPVRPSYRTLASSAMRRCEGMCIHLCCGDAGLYWGIYRILYGNYTY